MKRNNNRSPKIQQEDDEGAAKSAAQGIGMDSLRILSELHKLISDRKNSRAEVEKDQRQKLYKMLRYAYDHSAYYRKAFEACGIDNGNLENHPITDFPVMEKDELIQHQTEILTGPLESAHAVHSSGSAGQAHFFYYDNHAWNTVLAGIIRGALWGLSEKEIFQMMHSGVRVMYIAATDGAYAGVMAIEEALRKIRIPVETIDINDPIDVWVRKISDFRPDFLIGYPSAIKIIATMQSEGLICLSPVRVVTCGEPLNSGIRQVLEEYFHCPIVNYYGSSEFLCLGAESNPEEGMWLFDDLNYVEVINGQMYVTSLYNHLQPLIRYHLTDRLAMRTKPLRNAACHFHRSDIVLSREEEIMWFTDAQGKKDFIHPLSIEGFCIEGLMDYQFVQTGKASFTVMTQIQPHADEEQVRAAFTEQIGRILHQKGMDELDFRIQFTDFIQPDPRTGKKKLVRIAEQNAEEENRPESAADKEKDRETKKRKAGVIHMMKKQTAAVIMTAVLAASLIGGCGSTSSSGTFSETQTAQSDRVDEVLAQDSEDETNNTQLTDVNITFGSGGRTYVLTMDNNRTALSLLAALGDRSLNLPIYDYNASDVYQYYDVSSAYDIETDPAEVKEEKAGEVYLEDPGRLLLFYQDADVEGEYTKVGRIEDTDGLAEAVENNPVLEGWGNEIISVAKVQ